MEKTKETYLPTTHKLYGVWGVLNGPRTLRPHYHAAVFGYWPPDAILYKNNEVGDRLYTSQELTKIWGNGFVIIGNLTYESAAYIARYVYKKAYGGQKIPIKAGKTPEYTTCSKKPAIAKNFYFDKEKWIKLLRNNGVLIQTKDGLKIKNIPQYLKNKWKEDDHENYYIWQDNNKRENIHNLKQILQKTTKNVYQYGRQTKDQKKASLNRLDKFRTKDL